MKRLTFTRFLVIGTFLLAGAALVAEQAELKVEVKPKEAFIFVDGKAYAHHDRKLELTPGNHTIGVYNYGFIGQEQAVTLHQGDNPDLNITLQPAGDPVQGPWGRLRIDEVHGRDAIFSNGKSVEFFIGHADETDSHATMSQKMILPVGMQQITVYDPKEDKEIFSGPVEIKANSEAVLDAEKGTVHYQKWAGAGINSLPRFSSTHDETIVAVAPVLGNLAADPAAIDCNQPVRLSWNVKDAVHGTLKANGVPVGEIPLTGEQTVSPRQTTTYELTAVGPGGVFTTTQTVRVNPTIQTSLEAVPKELGFKKVEERIVEQGTGKLNWTASNADAVRIEDIGVVNGTSGEQTITATPAKSDFGPVDEMKTYRITATNVCGGSDTSTASVHITGSIDHEVAQAMPETASPLPLLGLLGLGSLASGAIIRKFRKNR